MIKGAKFSEDRKYRYYLYRIWRQDLPYLQVIGLNPSTANEDDDDPTIKRVIKFAFDWGYGGIYMTNLFSFVSTKPKSLLSERDPVGENDKYLMMVKRMTQDVLFAWGNFDTKGRSTYVEKMFNTASCLGLNKNGSPKHPLYIAANTQIIKFK